MIGKELAAPLVLMIVAIIIQRRTNAIWALWISFASALAAGILFAASPLGETLGAVPGKLLTLAPVIIGAAVLTIAGVDAVDQRPEGAAVGCAFVFPMFYAPMMASGSSSEGMVIACALIALLGAWRSNSQRSGKIKWAAFAVATVGGVFMLGTPWMSTLTGVIGEVPTLVLGCAVIVIIVTDVIGDKRPDLPAITSALFAPALMGSTLAFIGGAFVEAFGKIGA